MKRLDKVIQLLDRAFWTMVIVWAILDAVGVSLLPLLAIGLLGISIVFFIEANRPIEIENTDEEAGFSDLLGLSIVPKVLGISSSVATVGILFYQLQMPGYAMMLNIGFTTILICLLILSILRVTGTKHIEKLFPRLIRSVIIAAAALFILFV